LKNSNTIFANCNTLGYAFFQVTLEVPLKTTDLLHK